MLGVRQRRTFPIKNFRFSKQGIVELYGVNSTEMERIPKNIYCINKQCSCDIDNRSIVTSLINVLSG